MLSNIHLAHNNSLLNNNENDGLPNSINTPNIKSSGKRHVLGLGHVGTPIQQKVYTPSNTSNITVSILLLVVSSLSLLVIIRTEYY